MSVRGAAALPAPVPIDRRRTAADLGFDRIYMNSLDAVGARDFVWNSLQLPHWSWRISADSQRSDPVGIRGGFVAERSVCRAAA